MRFQQAVRRHGSSPFYVFRFLVHAILLLLYAGWKCIHIHKVQNFGGRESPILKTVEMMDGQTDGQTVVGNLKLD